MSLEKVVNFGCRLNAFESQIIKNSLQGIGNDIVVFNTCSVTAEAEREVIKSIRKTKRDYPDKKIIVTGCASQIDPSKYSAMAEVDRVLGNEDKFSIDNYDLSKNNDVIVSDIMEIKETANHLISGFDGDFEKHTRAFVQIQNGCNHNCTFCIIPYGRGRSRSVPIGAIVNQLKILVDRGYKEVVFTGVDISDYGLDLPAKPTLGSMIKRVLRLVPNLPRLRLSSIDVAEIDDELMELILHEPRLMNHLHISLQAGDNMILKRMKRRHNREQVVEFCNYIRNHSPHTAFGADIIAGFPTETDKMFENTLNLVSDAKLQYLHVFPYSEREGTPAARMPQVDKSLRKQRAALLRDAGKQELDIFSKAHIGEKVSAIIEKNSIGRSENFLKLHFNNADKLNLKVGDIVGAKVTKYEGDDLFAEVI